MQYYFLQAYYQVKLNMDQKKKTRSICYEIAGKNETEDGANEGEWDEGKRKAVVCNGVQVL